MGDHTYHANPDNSYQQECHSADLVDHTYSSKKGNSFQQQCAEHSPSHISLEKQTFLVHNVPGDGNCFFHCLSTVFHGDISETKRYRHSICTSVYRNWNQWKETAKLYHNPSITSFSYWGSMIKLNGSATACEIEAASNIYDCKIKVWLKGEADNFTSTTFLPENGDDSSRITIHLLLDNNHFQLLRPNKISQSEPDYVATKMTTQSKAQMETQPQNGYSFMKTEVKKTHAILDEHDYASKTNNNKKSLGEFIIFSPKPNKIQGKQHLQKEKTHSKKSDRSSLHLHVRCRKLGIEYEYPPKEETEAEHKLRLRRITSKVKRKLKQVQVDMEKSKTPQAPHSTDNQRHDGHTATVKLNMGDHTYPAKLENPFQQQYHQDYPSSSSRISFANQDFSVHNVPGDGNCFFHCLSTVFHGDLSQTKNYRHTVCTSVYRNWDLWEETAKLTHTPSITPFSYWGSMIKLDGWATACEIEAASKIYDCNIKVWLKGEANTFTLTTFLPENGEDSEQITIHLLLENNHFQVLRPNTMIQSEPDYVATKITVQPHQKVLQPSKKVKSKQTHKISDEHDYASKTNRKRKSLGEFLIYSPKSNKIRRKLSTNATTENKKSQKSDHSSLHSLCRKLGIKYEYPPEKETEAEQKLRIRRLNYKVKTQLQQVDMDKSQIPEAPPPTNNVGFDRAMDSIRAFELKQMSYQINQCRICHERRIDMKMATSDICRRCKNEKDTVKMFSAENNMDPQKMPDELQDLTVVEQQLISRISPCINVHMLKHGGIASSGHCVTFPQEVNEPAQIFPRLPQEMKIIRVRKQGKNDTSKDFRVRRFTIQSALSWLKLNNKAYSDIIISQERLDNLPIDGELSDITTVEYQANTTHGNDKGPANDQTDPGEIEGDTHSSVLLPEPAVDLRKQVETIVEEVVGENHGGVTKNKQGTITIPWPTRSNIPVSEFTTQYFFTLAFPTLFPYGTADFYINRPRTFSSLGDWADHLLWYEDGRFAKHQFFKFVVHNMIMRKRAVENSNFIVNQQLGDRHLTVSDLKEQLQKGDASTAKKILYFGASLRGTSQYWGQRAKELRSLIQFKINEGSGLPSFFTTGSCAEYHFKPLRRLLAIYVKATTGTDPDLNDRTILFSTLQANTHIVAQYFDLRTQSYFKEVMGPVFGVDAFWYRQEFAKSRGMVHWHGLCWRSDKEPHKLIHEALKEGLTEENCAQRLSEWASNTFGLSASHPAGTDDHGQPRKDLWPPPEGSAPVPPEEKNPLVKLLMDVSVSQETLLEDHLLLTNRFNIHRCSDYCLTTPKSKASHQNKKLCRMEFPKTPRLSPEMVKDRNGSLRLEMSRDHQMLVQHSMFHTQAWRANGDISLILSKSGTENPSVDEILATEKYITGYACKGNQPTGAVADLFKDMVNCADDSTGASAKSLCTKLLMGTVKRDISAVEASYELSSLPLYRSSHTFQSVSLSGSRVFERDGSTLTRNTPLDRYIQRNDEDTSSFYNYICKHGKVPVINGSSTQATWPLDDSYCRTMLLLHWPNWRNISDIKDDTTSWTDKMINFLESDICPNFLKADVERVKKPSHEHPQEDDDDLVDNENLEEPEWMDLVRPNVNFDDISSDFMYDDGGADYDWGQMSLEYPTGLGLSWLEKLNELSEDDDEALHFPEVQLLQMNDDQLFAFNIILQRLMDYKQVQDNQNFQPLRLVVSGTAGSGKSYLIKCLVKAIRTVFQSNKSVQVLCPTGNSANLISGVTLHSFLKIPTTHRGHEMKPPDGTTGITLQDNCAGVHALLIDERSLIGATTLGWMEFHCSYGMSAGSKSTQSWGGIPVVVFLGDDVQLPPVLDSPVYNSSGKSSAAIHGAMVWQEFQTVVNLKNIIRQGNEEQQFRDTLMALRQYKTTQDQAKWLQNFQWNNLKSTHGVALLTRMSDRGLFVFPTHEEEWQHNKAKLMEANKTFPVAKLKAETKGPHSKTGESEKAGGLINTLFLCKNAKVMLSVNLCVQYGLFNGAIGTVADIIYLHGKKPADSLPDVVMVEFPNYSGRQFLKQNNKLIPLVPVQRKLDCRCHFCRRKQIPLRLGWATTIHRCQGMTIGEGEPNRYIVINPGTRSFESRNPGALFVALSRAKSTGAGNTDPDFAWNPSVFVNEDRLCHVVCTATTRARANEIARIQNLAKQTQHQFVLLYGNTQILSSIQELIDTAAIYEE